MHVYRTLEPDEPFDGQRVWYVAIYSPFYPNLLSLSSINGRFDDNTTWGAFMLSEVDCSTIIIGRQTRYRHECADLKKKSMVPEPFFL